MTANLKMLLLMSFLLGLDKNGAQWIDPYDMNTNAKDTIQLKNNNKISSTHNCKLKDEFYDSDVHLRRIIGLLLKNAYLMKEKSSYSGHINFDLSTNEYEFLYQFSASNDKLNDEILRKINSILETALKKTYFEHFSEELFSFKDKFYRHFFNIETVILLIFTLTLYSFYKLRNANFSLSLIFKYFLVLCYVVDWMLTFLQLRSESEIQTMIELKELGSVPPQCEVTNMSWSKYFKYLVVTETECQKYYLAANRNMIYFITPLKVFTRQFGVLIVKPLEYVGNGLGLFYKAMFASLPWGLNLILFPLICISIGATFIIILVFLTRTPIKINILHLFQLEFGEPQMQRLTYEHRPFIENVSPKKIKQKNDEVNKKTELLDKERDNDQEEIVTKETELESQSTSDTESNSDKVEK